MEIKKTNRGFNIAEFKDQYGVKCSLQQSSAAMYDAIWLGVDDADPKIMMSDAIRMGMYTPKEGESVQGWVSFPIPKEVLLSIRMHLTRDQATLLLPHLLAFVQTGSLDTPEKTSDFNGTKGDWFYQEDSDAYTHIVRPVENPGYIISHLSQDTSGKTEANARLIAAAPELLQAALDFINKVESGRAHSIDSYGKFKSAVSKALNR